MTQFSVFFLLILSVFADGISHRLIASKIFLNGILSVLEQSSWMLAPLEFGSWIESRVMKTKPSEDAEAKIPAQFEGVKSLSNDFYFRHRFVMGRDKLRFFKAHAENCVTKPRHH